MDDDQLRTGNTCDIKDREGFWFWNKSVKETDSDSEYNRKSDDKELDCRPKESRNKKEGVLETQPGELQWKIKGEKELRGECGKGFWTVTKKKTNFKRS